MKLKDLTHTIKEHMPVCSDIESLKLENCDGSPIRAIAQFEQK